MTEKTVVIGSNSFSGANFIDYALEQGLKVIGISRSEEPSPVFLPFKKNLNSSNFHFCRLDLNHNLNQIMSVLDDFQPSYIVNFAAQSMVAESWTYPEHWFMTNVVSNVKLHDQLRRRSYLKKYVHVSTPEVYGSCSGDVKEDKPYNPSTPYAVSRAACDLSLQSFYKNYQFPVAFTRAANVYGPGQQIYRIIPKTILSIKLGKKLQLHGGGHSVRSFINIRDVAEGTLKVARGGLNGEVYHFSTPIQISIRQLVDKICNKLNVNFKDSVEIVDERPGKDAAYLLDSSKSRETLDWKDRVNLDTGIDETVSWVEENYQELSNQPLDYIHKP